MQATIDTQAKDYMDILIEDAKRNPPISKGMLVKVLAHKPGKPMVGAGIVMRIFWSDFYCQYCADVELPGGDMREGVLACNMERVNKPQTLRSV